MRIHLGDLVRDVDFRIGDVVYHRCRDEPVRGLVVGYKVCPDDLLYVVVWGSSLQEQFHYGIELAGDRPGVMGADLPGDRGRA